MSLIRVRKLTKSYHGQKVLRGLDLEVNAEETVVILGRSGVGKSVLLKQIMGLERPDSGSVEIQGLSISKASGQSLSGAVRQMGMLFQGAALFDSLTIAENIAFPLRHRLNPQTELPYTSEEIAERVDWALKMVELSETHDLMPAELSGGMRKRAALARLIVYKPKILCLDEPTTGLDLLTGGQINNLIVQTQKELRATIIAVTHDMFSALRIGHRIAFHEDGVISRIVNRSDFLRTRSPLMREFLQSHRQVMQHLSGDHS